MSNPEWADVERALATALERPAGEREAYIVGLAPAVRAEVESLLEAHGHASEFLERPQTDPRAIGDGFELAAGVQLGPYRIAALLGEGGMGQVYQAFDTKLNRPVAIKFLSGDVADPAARRRFQREAQIASSLNHPHILTVYDVGELDGRQYLVTEFVDGGTLNDWARASRRSWRAVVELLVGVADGLATAHAAGILHCDIKPENILVAKNGYAKLADFGLAKLTEGSRNEHANRGIAESRTRQGAILGTIAYMSPEQASGTPLDARSDIFSFGIVLYELLAGHRPFAAKTDLETLQTIIHAEPGPLGPDTPAALRALVEKALDKDPDARYQTMRDFVVDLRRAERKRPDAAALAPAGLRSLAAQLWIAGCVALLFAAGVLTWLTKTSGAASDNPLVDAHFTRLTDFPGEEQAAAISSDGKFVTFLSDRDGPFDIFVSQVGSGRFINLTLGREQNLTGGNSNMRALGFSGDGSQIVFRDEDPTSSMRIMPLMGGEPRTFLGKQSVEVAWSPDGTRLVYHPSADGDPLFVADHTGADARQIFISEPGVHNHSPVWSPDGNWIYFVRGIPAANQMDLWRISPAGGAPERLTQLNSKVGYPTPISSRTLLYTALDAKGSGPWLWALDVQRKVTRPVSFGLEKYTSVAATADGRRLVATVTNPLASLWSIPIRDRPAEERDAKPFPLPTVRALMPRFGGTSLFYLSSQDSGDGLWRYEDGEVQEIWKGSEGALLEPPGPSADGRRVALVLRRDGRLWLQLEDSDGTDVQRVAPGLDVQGAPSWSPDGKWIVTGGADAKGAGLFKIAPDGTTIVRLTNGIALNPVWAPDGSLIVYMGANMGGKLPLLAVRPDGTPFELPKITVQRDGERVRFLPAGSRLIYTQGISRSAQDFWLLDLATMTSRPISHLASTAAIRAFDVTPDGKQIIFDRLRDNADIALIDLPR